MARCSLWPGPTNLMNFDSVGLSGHLAHPPFVPYPFGVPWVTLNCWGVGPKSFQLHPVLEFRLHREQRGAFLVPPTLPEGPVHLCLAFSVCRAFAISSTCSRAFLESCLLPRGVPGCAAGALTLRIGHHPEKKCW